jgi:DNA-directed RNA polymerase subunit omega|tara:strand:+ start:298 stop:768 length:471 start_codon:yes stop_codon:yes gene_type:complete
MARITVEDCLEKVESQFDLVLLARERAAQLNAGEESLVPHDNDKNTVISLREIGEGKISIKNLEDLAINKLREQQEETVEVEEAGESNHGDDFHTTYKGEISKSGTAILPSKRVRRIPEKVSLETLNSDDNIDDKKKDENIEQTDQKISPPEAKPE